MKHPQEVEIGNCGKKLSALAITEMAETLDLEIKHDQTWRANIANITPWLCWSMLAQPISANQGEEGSPDLRSAGYLLPSSGSEILRYDLALWQRGIERIWRHYQHDITWQHQRRGSLYMFWCVLYSKMKEKNGKEMKRGFPAVTECILGDLLFAFMVSPMMILSMKRHV